MNISQLNTIPLMILPDWINQVLVSSLQNGLSLNSDFLKRPSISSTNGSIGIINIKGALFKRMSLFDMLFSEGTTYDQIQESINLFLYDSAITQIMLKFDSPGGSAEGSFELSDFIFQAREKKKIISVAQGMMASAAYLIGSSAHEVYTSKSSFLGSIGVITVHLEISKMAEKMGITPTIIRSGEFKALGSSQFEPLNKLALDTVQSRSDYLYGLFKNSISRNLDINAEAVQNIAEGKVFIGQQAVDVGLANELKTVDSVFEVSTSISLNCDKDKEKEMNLLDQVKAALNETDISKRDLLIAKIAEEKPKEVLASLKFAFNGMQMFKENWDDQKLLQFSQNIESILKTGETQVVKPKTETELRAELEMQFSANVDLKSSVESLKKMVLDSQMQVNSLEGKLQLATQSNKDVTEKLRKEEILKELQGFNCIGNLQDHVKNIYQMELLDQNLAKAHVESLRQNAEVFAKSGLTTELGSGQGGNPKASFDLLEEKANKYAEEFELAGMPHATALEKGFEKAYKENPSLFAEVAKSYQ